MTRWTQRATGKPLMGTRKKKTRETHKTPQQRRHYQIPTAVECWSKLTTVENSGLRFKGDALGVLKKLVKATWVFITSERTQVSWSARAGH